MLDWRIYRTALRDKWEAVIFVLTFIGISFPKLPVKQVMIPVLEPAVIFFGEAACIRCSWWMYFRYFRITVRMDCFRSEWQED